MAGALVQSTTFPWAVSSESKIGSKQFVKKRIVRMMRSLQTPPMRVRTFSGLWGVNGLDNMVFHSTVAAATSVSREKASQIVPKAMFELFTENANKVIKFAQEEARRSGYNFVGTELILLGLIGDGDDIYHGDIAAKVLRSMGIYLNHARVEVADMTGGGSGFDSLETPFTPCALHAFELSLEEAQLLGHNYIGSEHLLLGLLRAGEGVNLVLRNLGASTNNIRVQVIKMVEESAEVVGGKSSRNKMPTLVAYGINLTELADEKKLCPVVGSQPLIRSAIQILGRVTKKNPCLVGGRGVGKTSIAEGVAQSITAFDVWVPDCLRGKQVITLDMHLLVQGRFVERLKKLVEEMKQNGEIILFIDDVHTLFGAGVAEGAIGAANILRRALARGELQCIGSTTLEEYRKHIEKDPTLERLFQPVKVPEPTVYETIKILMEIKEYYEHHHKVRYTREALVAAAHLSYECLSDRCLPGKAIDLIDEAGTFVRSGEFDLPYSELLKTLEFVRKHLLITKEEIAAVGNKDLEKAGMLWDQEMRYRTEILEIEKRIKEVKKNAIEVDTTVTEADIETIVSSWSLHN